MNTYTVHQLNITTEIYDYVNAHGHQAAIDKFPVWGVKLNSSFIETVPTLTAEIADYYRPVAKIMANDLEHVFQVGNMGPAENIQRLAERMASVSVGDIIVDDATGEAQMVLNFGFGTVDFNTVQEAA